MIIAFVMLLWMTLWSQDLVTRRYTVNDGLPTSSIISVYEDKQGYLWIATYAGLSRFDGAKFKNYGMANGLPSYHTINVMEDRHNRIWIGTEKGPAQLLGDQFKTYPTSDGLDVNYTFSIIETKSDCVWALTDVGVYQFNDTIWQKLILYPGMDHKPCRQMIETPKGMFLNYRDILVKLEMNGKWKIIGTPYPQERIFNMMSQTGGKLYVSTATNVYRIENDKLNAVFRHSVSTNNLINYYVDSKGQLWLYQYEKGILLFAANHYDSLINNLPRNYELLFTLYEDSHENIWASTSDGLLKIKKVAFRFAAAYDHPATKGLRNVVPLQDGRLIVLNNTKGMLLFDGNDFKPIPKPKNGKKIDSMDRFDLIDDYAYDEKGQPWMITRYRKLYCFEANQLIDYSSALERKTYEYLYSILYNKETSSFFICGDSVLLEGNHKGFHSFIPINTHKPVNRPTKMCQAANGDIIIYIDKSGLFKINKQKELISLVKESGITATCVKISKDLQQGIWIAVSGLGLYYFNYSASGKLKLINKFTEKDGLQNDFIHDIVVDRYNRIWVASETGIDILSKEQNKWNIYNYSNDNQLQLQSWWDTKMAHDHYGNIWLSSLHHLIAFKTQGIRLHSQPPALAIEKISLDRKGSNWNEFTDSFRSYAQIPINPVLNHQNNSLRISFNGISFSANTFIEYAYKLEPLDDGWSEPTPSNFVSLINLSPGHYTFLIKTRDKASGWGEPAVFSFTISRPFYQMWWFKILVLLIIGLLFFLLYRTWTNKIKHEAAIQHQLRMLEIKALKSQMNPHFVYNSLNSIQALIADGKQLDAIRYIGSFSRLLRQILHHADNVVITLDKELENLKFYIELESLRLNKELDFAMNLEETVIPENEKIPPLIIQPFIENAIWHGLSSIKKERKLSLQLSAKDEWLICTIQDNGIGRKASQYKKTDLLHQSKGVEITKKRLLDYNGSGKDPIIYTDLRNDIGNAIGTRVDLYIMRR